MIRTDIVLKKIDAFEKKISGTSNIPEYIKDLHNARNLLFVFQELSETGSVRSYRCQANTGIARCNEFINVHMPIIGEQPHYDILCKEHTYNYPAYPLEWKPFYNNPIYEYFAGVNKDDEPIKETCTVIRPKPIRLCQAPIPAIVKMTNKRKDAPV